MEHWVVDASVLAQAFVKDNYSAQIFSLLATAGSSAESTIHVPEFCVLECTNVLWKRARFEDQDRQQTMLGLQNLLALPLVLYYASPLMPRALEIGLAHNLAVYDSLYIALAETLSCPLITVDRRQSQAAEAAGITLKAITDFTAPDAPETG